MSSLNPPPRQIPTTKDPQQRVFFEQLTESVRLIHSRMTNTTGFILVQNTPASASAFGKAGMVAVDSDYIYVCVADDTWKRAAISTW